MLGWYFDEILVYLFRTIVRLVVEFRSRAWPLAEGKVEESRCEFSLYPTSEVTYVYGVERNSYKGTAKRAFFWNSSAKQYTSRFTPERLVTVRYNANEPAKSVLRESPTPR